ncbi:MAG TPA: LemA family protein [Thermoanaerobaculia bacterium]|nr:LemA family protein [Thermoanaerobaculia bacterium]
MKKALGCLGVLAVIGVVVGFMAVGRYNALVAGEQRVEEAWSQVQNVYQRRADLVPNLVETVKGSADFEQETLTAVVEARSRVGQLSTQASEELLSDPQKFAQFQQAQDGLSSALSRLLVVVERYPEIQSTVAFRDLMTQLEGTENRIAVERRRFNEVARDFNTTLATFPTNVIARVLGWHFAKRPYFEAAAGAEQAPRVDFSGN